MPVFAALSAAVVSLWLLPFGVLHAQGEIDASPPQYYQVELLLFRHLDQSRTTEEIPRMVEQDIDDILNEDLPLLEDMPQATTAVETPTPQSQPVYLLEREQYLLNDVANRLSSLNAYEIIGHRSWLQTAPDVSAAWELNLADIDVDPGIIAGQVKLYRRRYLHLGIDVALTDGNPFGSAFQMVNQRSASPAIADSRRIRLTQLVYFDQPQFGVIAYVARSEFQPGTAE